MEGLIRREALLNASMTSLGGLSAGTFGSSSDFTASTLSIVPGPGALAGKAILALGKVTLRGAEHLIIRRRLLVISSKFPHRNMDNIKGIEQMYDDLLELSRPDMYPDAIRIRALHMIAVQIGSGHTRYLVKSLMKWPSIETTIFISVLVSFLDPLRLVQITGTGTEDVSNSVWVVYQKSLVSWENHSLEPLIKFLRHVAQSSNLANIAVLEGGVMDLLLHLYVSNFHDPFSIASHDFQRGLTLFAGCSLLLTVCSSAQGALNIISGHPIYTLWTPHFSGNSVGNSVDERMKVWGLMKPDIILWRIRSIFNMMLDWKRPYDESLLFYITIDLLEISGSDKMEPEITIRALRSFHAVICAHGNFSAQRAIRQCLASSTINNFTRIMTNIMLRLSRLVTTDTEEWKIFFSPWDESKSRPVDERSFKTDAVLQIIRSFISAAEADEIFLDVIRKANVLGLLRPFLEMEFRDTSRIAHHEGDMLMTYDEADYEVLGLIREHGLRPLLPLVPENFAHVGAFQKSVVCRAFNVMLRPENSYRASVG